MLRANPLHQRSRARTNTTASAIPVASAATSVGSKPLLPCASHSSLPTPSAKAAEAAAAWLRLATMSAAASVNDSEACSSRSGRASPICQARTRGAGNSVAGRTRLESAERIGVSPVRKRTVLDPMLRSGHSPLRCAHAGVADPAAASSRSVMTTLARSTLAVTALRRHDGGLR